MNRAEIECAITNELGLHLRAAAAFVKVAEEFKSGVTLVRDGLSANGKSIIEIPRGCGCGLSLVLQWPSDSAPS